MRRKRGTSILSNPVLIGAVTTLVITIAVFLAYNANQGLPFVPVYEIKVETRDAARLVVGNEVREGGFRIGQISEIEPVPRAGGELGAQLHLSLDKSAGPLPADSRIVIRPRSTLGLKYVDVVRGSSQRTLTEGSVLRASEGVVPPELDDFFAIFDADTREDIRVNLVTFGGGFAGRGEGLNRALADLPGLLGGLVPVMSTLADPETRLRAMFRELGDAARVARPVSNELVEGFEQGALVFEAFSRHPQALRDTISLSPGVIEAGLRSFPVQRRFLQRLAGISDEIAGSAAALRRGAPPLSRALAAGTRTLPDTPPFNRALARSLDALADLSASPTTNLVLGGLRTTMQTLNPTLRYVGPQITVCNYWNYWWTLLSDHLSETDATGTVQRIQVKNAAGSLTSYGSSTPANGEPVDPARQATEGDPPNLHGQPYGRAVDEQGNADCESGQRGYPRRLAQGAPPNLNIAVDARTPGSQGKTFTGRPRVPAGQTFSAEPGGTAPAVTP